MNTDPCAYYEKESAQNPDFAWCRRLYLHLDPGGRLCRFCKTDPQFLQRAERQAVVRKGPDCTDGLDECVIFGGVTDDEQCERCRTDAVFRALLSGQSAARTAALFANANDPANTKPLLPCSWRGEWLRDEERKCCGGKTSIVPIYACEKKAETHAGLCAVCTLLQSP